MSTNWGCHASEAHFTLSVYEYQERNLSDSAISKILGTSGAQVARVVSPEVSDRLKAIAHRNLLTRLRKAWPAPPHCFEEVVYD